MVFGIARVARALRAQPVGACHPSGDLSTSDVLMEAIRVVRMPAAASVAPTSARAAADALVARLFAEEGASLVRLARFFVDDRTAAEDLVQEAFIRFTRSAHRIRSPDAAPAYLRSIVLNLARDHNRRGLVSLRHHLPEVEDAESAENELFASEERREVVEALRRLPLRQRDSLVLRYFLDLGVDGIAATMKISRNSVKTHLKRGLAALERDLGGGA